MSTKEVAFHHLGSEAKGQEATEWMDFGPPKTLGHLSTGEFQNYAWVANFDGSVLAGYAGDNQKQLPVRWVGGSKALSLGKMPSQYKSGMARGISDDGKTIVGLWGSGETGCGFIWTTQTGMIPVADFLKSHGLVAEIAGLKLTAVIGITADGHTIVGECFDGRHHPHGYRANF